MAVGLVLGAFGPDGLVRVRSLSEFPGRLLGLDKVWLTPAASAGRDGPAGPRAGWRRILAAEEHGDGTAVLRLDGVTSRERAAALRGALLELPEAEAKPLPPGRFYRFQLLGLVVRDETGRVLGRVREVLETGANDVFVVAADGASGTKDEVLVPGLRDVVLKLDPAAGEMVVRLPREWGDDREI